MSFRHDIGFRTVKAFCRALLAALAAALLTGGCEDDSLDLTIHAHPESLWKGETCHLVAYLEDRDLDEEALGSDFTWSLSDPSIGYLSRTRGRHVDYYPTRFPVAPEKELVQTVFCKFDGTVFSHHTRQKVRHLPARQP